MAILQQPVVGGNVFADQIGDDLAPAGTYVATVLDIVDEFGVQRQKFQSMEMETVDLTTFLFGFLKSLLGHAPQYGWDYMAIKGAQCLVTVEHIQRRDGTGVFAGIAALSPVPPGMGQPNGQLAVGGGQAGSGAVAPRAPVAAQRPPSASVRPAMPSPAGVPAGRLAPPKSAGDPLPF